MENVLLRLSAAAILLGSLVGCALSVRSAHEYENDEPQAIVAPVGPARPIAPLAVPPRADYGHPYLQSRLHPLIVAGGIAAFSLFGLAAFPPHPSRRTSAPRKTAHSDAAPSRSPTTPHHRQPAARDHAHR